MHRQFVENETQITFKYMSKRIRKIKIKATLVYHYLSIRWTKHKRLIILCGQTGGKQDIFVCC